jgi:transposase
MAQNFIRIGSVLKTGARWQDVPKGEQWASKTCAHKWLGIWMESGVLEKVLKALQEIGVTVKAIDLSRISVDGFFSAGKGGGEEVDHGYKGKGVTTHTLVDTHGSPLAMTSTGVFGDERKEVRPLLDKVESWVKSLIHRGIAPVFKADKGIRLSRSTSRSQKDFPLDTL